MYMYILFYFLVAKSKMVKLKMDSLCEILIITNILILTPFPVVSRSSITPWLYEM